MEKINISALGLALGAAWAFLVFTIGITSIFGWGTIIVEVLSSLYIGYNASLLGAIIGALWAFTDGFVGGVITAWVYNKFAK